MNSNQFSGPIIHRRKSNWNCRHPQLSYLIDIIWCSTTTLWYLIDAFTRSVCRQQQQISISNAKLHHWNVFFLLLINEIRMIFILRCSNWIEEEKIVQASSSCCHWQCVWLSKEQYRNLFRIGTKWMSMIWKAWINKVILRH